MITFGLTSLLFEANLTEDDVALGLDAIQL